MCSAEMEEKENTQVYNMLRRVKRKMKQNKRLIPVVSVIAILLVVRLILNVMLNNFGETLTGY